ncbi:intraflagellar transport protein 88 homolog isoform X2 [Lingula anatina]|uniref:Intraflagellar transport protein 88 homolog n=1 Tax=Lingula anatina TaxID=7574 RepID=A0A1S3HGH7_LINAN|nr:intraflagellar transport protein 88 homolog isoform X2 [Lingula anatina]|eukprot:XP_013385188.1 intraflagellar transport protein 88 homolog isoform X2 [Lingula anatina]
MNRLSMMEQVHLAGEDEDDLYSGYNDYNATLDTEDLANDEGFQHAVRTSHGRRPPPTAKIPLTGSVGARLATAKGQGGLVSSMGRNAMPSSMGARPMTGAQDGAARPMTAVRAAGYSSFSKGAGFDPMNQAQAQSGAQLETKPEDTPEEKIKQLEKKVNELIEESCFANSRAEYQLALEKAKEAGRKERVLVRLREQAASVDQVNLDLTYSVLFNLANQYAANEMYAEALNTYQVIVKNKMFTNAGRLKVNMGNIYFKQKNYPKAIKFYRMAVDQVPNTHKYMRLKIMQNVGIAFVKLGQYNDAITTFEHIMGEQPDVKTGFNLVLCYFALGDREKMKKAFQKMLACDLKIDEEDKYLPHNDDKNYNLILEVIKNDALRRREKEKKLAAERNIKTAAKMMAPTIESSFAAGYDWCVDQVKTSNFVELSHDLEIDKALMYLRQKDFHQAVETLKSFEKKDSKVASTAATNLSFLYFLESDLTQADRYAEVALQADRYNPSALVNKGNCLFAKADYEKAREYYKEALQNDSSCIEALYNLGLAYKLIGRLEDSLDCFFKLHAIFRNNAQVMYQLADIHEQLGDTTQATEWFMQLIGVVPTDPTVLARLGEIYDNDGDKSQAFQYHYDSYRYFPSNIEVIEWLGAYYIDSQFCEKAISYFERAAIVEPTQVKWQLMVASCHRRSGNYQQALETYKSIHRKFPDNVECLKFLVRLCTDLGLKETQEYATKLKKAEKQKELKEQRASSGSRRGSGRRKEGRDGSAGSDSSSRAGSAISSAGHRSGGSASRRRQLLDEEDGDLFQNTKQDVDATYADPLGPQVERPKTAARKREPVEDEFADEELGDDLLPD